MNKNDLRRYFKEFLKNQQARLKSQELELFIINRINNLIDKLQPKTIGLYYPTIYEINLLKLIEAQPNISFFLPKIIGNEIEYYSYSADTEVSLNKYNIYEPASQTYCTPELIIIPGLAFSPDHYRLGYGGGFFDRYLFRNSKNLFSLGVCLTEQITNKFEIGKMDQKLNDVSFG